MPQMGKILTAHVSITEEVVHPQYINYTYKSTHKIIQFKICKVFE